MVIVAPSAVISTRAPSVRPILTASSRGTRTPKLLPHFATCTCISILPARIFWKYPIGYPQDIQRRCHDNEAGQPIGGNDLLVAAQAVALGYALVTDNGREFARIDALSREIWLCEA